MSIPKWRWFARWPALALTVGATAAAYVAKLTGGDLQDERKLNSPLVKTHEEWGDRLVFAMWIFAALMVVAFWVLPHVTRIAGSQDRGTKVAALELPLTVLVPFAAVAVLVLVVITGDAGARAVWS
jgi:hypothetical protein